MKKIFLVLAVASLSLASCKKDYTCECVRETLSGGSESESHNTGKMSRADAKAKCDDGDKTDEVFGETYTTECTLK